MPRFNYSSAAGLAASSRQLLQYCPAGSAIMIEINSTRIKEEKKSEDEVELSFDEITSMFLRHMRLHAVLPMEGKRFDYLPTRGLLCYFLCSSLINWSMLVCYCIRMKNLTVDAICETVMIFGLNVRFYLLIGRRYEYAELIDECRSIWNECCDVNERNLIVAFARKVQFLFFFFVCGCIGVVLLYTVTALNTRITTDESNGTERKILPYKWYIDNPEDYWPGYTATFIIQTLVVSNAALYLVIVDTAIPLLIMICCGFLRNVSDRLREASDENFKGSFDHDSDGQSFLLDCCKLHRRVLNLCLRLEKFARGIFLVQVLCTGYNMSLLAIKLAGTDSDRYKYTPMLLLSVGQLFICQWSPDSLIDESLGVATAAYFATCSWMRRHAGKILMIVLARAQKPVQMTAGGFINLSLESYGHMITSAFSFFTMLRKVNL